MDEIKAEQSAMMRAAKEGYGGGVLMEARAGADLGELDSNGKTVLDLVLESQMMSAAKELLALGADSGSPNAPIGASDFTPLHWAAWLGSAMWAQRLIERGADPAAIDAGGNTPLALALRQGQMQCAEVLLAGGADPKASQGQDKSILAMCARMVLPASVFWCLKNNADGGAPEAEALKAIGHLSDMDYGVTGQKDALAGVRAYLEALQITDSAPALKKRAKGSKRSGL